MATRLGRLHGRTDETTTAAIPGVDLLTPEEGRVLFDRRARQLLDISGEGFLRWDAGEYRPVPDTVEGRKVGEFVMLMPFARRAKS